MKRYSWMFALILLTAAGCANPNASSQKADVRDDTGERITVGNVQREIKVGMSSADVIAVLGSPNIVSTDEERRENWVYDKIATDRAYSNSGSGIMTLIIGPRDTGASETSQRTLTIVIKFDNQGKVRDFAYHTSRF